MMRLQFIYILVFFAVSSLFSQEKAEKWGVIPESDLKMTIYPQDSSAKAVVLQDVGKVDFPVNSLGSGIQFNRHRRVKILDNTALDNGNLAFAYTGKEDDYKLRNLDIYRFSTDGKKTKVSTDNIFTEELNKDWKLKKVFIPNLQKGDIIEYRYTIDFGSLVNLHPWEFQDRIPVRWSEFETDIPDYLKYVFIVNIYQNPEFDKSERVHDKTGSEFINVRHIALKNIPALKDEPFITTLDDYKSTIKMQLKEISIPGQTVKVFIPNWLVLAERVEDHDKIGKQYRKSNNFKKLLTASKTIIEDKNLDAEQKLEKISQFVSSNITWDETYDIFSTKDIDDAFTAKKGSSADINLSVVALCKEAGLEAYPMLVSTRKHGTYNPEYPFIEQFNSILAYVKLSDKEYRIIDATNPFLPVGLVSENHYNLSGWVARKDTPEWVVFKSPENTNVYIGDLELTENGTLQGKMTLNLSGHEAVKFRKTLKDNKEKDYIKSQFSDKYPDADVNEIKVEDAENLSQAVKINFNITIPNAAQVNNDYLYCPVITDFFIEENPFKTTVRQCPVNFVAPIKAQYILTLKTPEGYKVEELPSNVNFALPNDGGKLTFTCGATNDGKTQIVLRMNLKQLDFMPDEYSALRQFMDKVEEKNKDQIVLKKI